MTVLPYPLVPASGSSILRMSGDEKTIIFRVDSRVYPLGQVIPYYPVTAFFRGLAQVLQALIDFSQLCFASNNMRSDDYLRLLQ